MRLSLFFLLLTSLHASTVVSVSGPTGKSYSLGFADQILSSSWTQSQDYAGVSVSAMLGLFSPSAPVQVSAFLTTAIGPGTTAAQQIATTSVTLSTAGPSMTLLFDDLTLQAGTYYLTISGPSGSFFPVWYATNNPSTITDSSVAFNGQYGASTNSGAPNLLFPPASTFLPATLDQRRQFSVAAEAYPSLPRRDPSGACSYWECGCAVAQLNPEVGDAPETVSTRKSRLASCED